MRFGNKSRGTVMSFPHIVKNALKFYIEDLKSKPFSADNDWNIRRAEEVLAEFDKRVTPEDMMKNGGKWLGEARSWMQWEFLNGDSVTWGSDDILSQRSNLTPRVVEQFAAKIAAAAVNEDRD